MASPSRRPPAGSGSRRTRSATTPRPTAAAHPLRSPEWVAAQQAAWDAADGWRREHERQHAELQATADATRRADRERAAARADDLAARKQDAIAAELRARFVAAGGTAAQWAAVRDALVLEAIKRAALDGGDAARRAQAERTKAAF